MNFCFFFVLKIVFALLKLVAKTFFCFWNLLFILITKFLRYLFIVNTSLSFTIFVLKLVVAASAWALFKRHLSNPIFQTLGALDYQVVNMFLFVGFQYSVVFVKNFVHFCILTSRKREDQCFFLIVSILNSDVHH